MQAEDFLHNNFSSDLLPLWWMGNFIRPFVASLNGNYTDFIKDFQAIIKRLYTQDIIQSNNFVQYYQTLFPGATPQTYEDIIHYCECYYERIYDEVQLYN